MTIQLCVLTPSEDTIKVYLLGIPKQFLQEPIVEQDIMRITHKDTGKDLIRKGRALEAIVLTRTLAYKAEHHIIVNGTRTMFLIR